MACSKLIEWHNMLYSNLTAYALCSTMPLKIYLVPRGIQVMHKKLLHSSENVDSITIIFKKTRSLFDLKNIFIEFVVISSYSATNSFPLENWTKTTTLEGIVSVPINIMSSCFTICMYLLNQVISEGLPWKSPCLLSWKQIWRSYFIFVPWGHIGVCSMCWRIL